MTTNSVVARRYFDQGLAFLYGFNHDAALWSFRAAAVEDPNCAMAFWGVAAALGPDINNPEISPDDVQLAKSAIATARAVEHEGDGDRERADRGDRKRYSLDGSDEAIKCERSYATALLDLGKRFPGDPDVEALGAEALMIVQGKTSVKEKRALEPKKEIATILERILKECPDHPFALHLWIHSMDQLRQPERARTESDRLRQLAPGIGHLMHMPSHVDIRLGRGTTPSSPMNGPWLRITSFDVPCLYEVRMRATWRTASRCWYMRR